MDISIYLKAFFVLIIIISVIGMIVALIKLLKNQNILKGFAMNNKLKLEETLNIDHKRRLILCKLDKKKYLILLGQQDVLIDVIIE